MCGSRSTAFRFWNPRFAKSASRQMVGLPRWPDVKWLPTELTHGRAIPTAPLSGRYRFKSRLDAGTKAPTWLAEDESTGKDVVASVLPTARVAALMGVVGLKHAHLAGIIEVVDNPAAEAVPDGAPASGAVIVAEHVGGKTLHQALKTARLTPAEAITLWIRLCQGVAALHAAGGAHGAISPRSIVIELAGGRQGPILTQLLAPTSGAYCAPERLQGRGPSGADTWALHSTLFSALTGSPPFRGDKDQLLKSIASGQLQRLKDLGVNDEGLQELLSLGLVANTARRRGTAEQMIEALERWEPRSEGASEWEDVATVVATSTEDIARAMRDDRPAPMPSIPPVPVEAEPEPPPAPPPPPPPPGVPRAPWPPWPWEGVVEGALLGRGGPGSQRPLETGAESASAALGGVARGAAGAVGAADADLGDVGGFGDDAVVAGAEVVGVEELVVARLAAEPCAGALAVGAGLLGFVVEGAVGGAACAAADVGGGVLWGGAGVGGAEPSEAAVGEVVGAEAVGGEALGLAVGGVVWGVGAEVAALAAQAVGAVSSAQGVVGEGEGGVAVEEVDGVLEAEGEEASAPTRVKPETVTEVSWRSRALRVPGSSSEGVPKRAVSLPRRERRSRRCSRRRKTPGRRRMDSS